MRKPTLDQLLELLDVRLDAFAMCGIQNGWSLDVPPVEKVVVHFVLKGEGSLECEHGTFRIGPGAIIVVPPNLPKRINGRGPSTTVVPSDDVCPLADGIVQYRAYSEEADLVLGCGAVTANLAGGFGLLDLIKQPLVETLQDPTLTSLFDGIGRELSRPAAGTRTVISTLMKQILIALLRTHLSRRRASSPLYLPLTNPQLGRAILAIVAKPQEAHSVHDLANIAGMSRSTFTRNFSKSYGRSPMEFVQAVRLDKAAKLLRGSDLPVKAIAGSVGFASRSHFSRAFSAEFGLDPTTFRQVEEAELESGPDHQVAVDDGESNGSGRTAAPAETVVAGGEELIATEVNNRVRNALARVRSMARRASRGSGSVEEYARSLEERISAVARTQSLLTGSRSAQLGLEELATRVLGKAMREAPIEMSGPEAALISKEAEVLALALHELAANSAKYGALSRRSPIKLQWQVEERRGEDWLVLRWEEPGSSAEGPLRQGFGTELITRRIAYELDGSGSMQLDRHSFAATIEFPLTLPAEMAVTADELRQAAE